MSSAVRASSAANRSAGLTPGASARTTPSPSRKTSRVMNESMMSTLRPDDTESRDVDMEVSQINSFYSPVEGNSRSSRTSGMSTPFPPDVIYSQQDPSEEKLRKKLVFFFMNPLDKFTARRQAPWKLILQFGKIIFITIQILVFGQFRYAHTNYYKDNHIAFEHLFLKDWDTVREINAYPPSTGKYALYKKSTFYQYFDYTAATFSQLDDLTIVPTFKNSTLNFCVEAFKSEGHIDAYRSLSDAYEALVTSSTDSVMKCLSIPNESLGNFTSHDYLKAHDFDIPWDVMVQMHLNFTVNTVTSRQLGPMTGPECFNFHIKIVFDNQDHDGQIPIEMTSTPKRIQCPSPRILSASFESYLVHGLSGLVAITCLTSFILCCRALVRGQIICWETVSFFQSRYNVKLTRREQAQFLNFWYIMICVNDLLIIIGTVLKELIETKRTNSDLWDFCSVFLGIGNLLVWFGMLRYLGFFDTYNIIILTMKRAMPNIARFLITLGIMYLGFMFCGWVVLGPYQFKFYTLSSTSECLFSLINGDDMFATFNMVSAKSSIVWGFSRIYLYFFVIIFIYVVLSLFIAIIMDAYELIKENYKTGFPMSRIDKFYMAFSYDPYSTVFCEGYRSSYLWRIFAWYMMRRYGNQWGGFARERANHRLEINASADEHTPLLS